MKDTEKTKSDITEDLATLYLRLNGYFTTGFILHSPQKGKIRAEIDSIAVRFPHSSERERGVGPDPFLRPSSSQIDVVLCEVKRGKSHLQFNEALRKESERFECVLRWIGLFTDAQIEQLAPQLLAALTPAPIASPLVPEVQVDEHVRIRGFLFSPERNNASPRRTDPFFIGGDTIFNYAWRCLCPDAPRSTCATNYDYTRWGHLERIVRYFKVERKGLNPGTINDLYAFLERTES